MPRASDHAADYCVAQVVRAIGKMEKAEKACASSDFVTAAQSAKFFVGHTNAIARRDTLLRDRNVHLHDDHDATIFGAAFVGRVLGDRNR